MHSRLFFWPVSLVPILLVIFSPLSLMVLHQVRIAPIDVFFLIFIGYFVYFNSAYLVGRIRRKISEKITVKEQIDAGDMYYALKPDNFVSDHTIYSLLTPLCAGIFIVFLLIYHITFGLSSFSQTFTHAEPLEQVMLETAVSVSFLIAYSSIPRYYAIRISKTYPYYLAKAFLILSHDAKNSTIKLGRLIQGLEAYNTFLHRNFKTKIFDLHGFYSRLAVGPSTDLQETVKAISESFQNDRQDIDELQTIREIKRLKEKDQIKDFLSAADPKRKIQDWLPLVGSLIPLLVVLIELIARSN